MKKAPSMLLASAGVTVGLLGFALPASAAAGPANTPVTTARSIGKAPVTPQAQGSNGSDVKNGPSKNSQTSDKGQRDRKSHDNQNPCKPERHEPCSPKPCRTEKSKPCHSWTWHKPVHTVPCRKVEPCKPPKHRPCPPPVHKHHKKCDIRDLRA